MVSKTESLAWMNDYMKKNRCINSVLQHIVSGKRLTRHTYTATDHGVIAFSTGFPGNILPIDVAIDQEIIIPQSAFIACENGVRTDVFFNKKLYFGIFSHDQARFIKLSGQGKCFIQINSRTVEYQLLSGQQMIIDPASLAIMDASCQMKPQTAFHFISSRAVVTGPGRLVMQTALPYLSAGD